MSVGEAERAALLVLARSAVARALDGRPPPEIEPPLRRLREPRGAFVTVRRAGTGELRGCRGECPARRPLPECVRRVAVSASLDDPRFLPVSNDELPDVRFEISALTPARPIRPDEVVVGKHGLILIGEPGAGLLLPQVPIEQGWDREAFLDGLCWKAGLPPGAWSAPDVTLQAFEAEIWGEGDSL